MNLEKAMQVSRQILDGKELPSYADRNAAIALGFEAMQRDEKNRLIDNHPDQALLLGETEE